MGVLSDFFVATPEQVLAFTKGNEPQRGFTTLDSKGVDPVKLAKLQMILRGGDLKDSKRVVGLIPREIKSFDGGDICIWPVSEEVAAGLTEMNEERSKQVADAWFATEEFQRSRWSRAAFDQWYREFTKLVRDAAQSRKGVFLWMSV